jgi:hypothetical protein
MPEVLSDYTVEQHFTGVDPGVRTLYCSIPKLLGEFGPIEEDPKKTCIHLNRKSALAGVYVQKNRIRLEFKTAYSIENPRIVKSEQISRNRWHHVLPICSNLDLDQEVSGRLKDAWEISG